LSYVYLDSEAERTDDGTDRQKGLQGNAGERREGDKSTNVYVINEDIFR
jgi:hypothetical protein